MSTSAKTTNYSEAHEKQSRRFNRNSFKKSDRQSYVIAGTTRQNETQGSDGSSYRELDSPSRAKVVTMEFENVTDAVRINNSASSLERSSDLPRRTYSLRQQIPSSKGKEKFTSSFRSTVNRNELEDSRRDDRHRDKNLPDEGSGYVNSSISAASSSGDKSSRAKPIDRNHRSVTTTSSLGIVTATKTEVPSRLAALREDFALNKRSSSVAEQDSKEVSENRSSHRFSEGSQSKPGRRRRRALAPANEHSEPTTNRYNFSRKSGSNDSEKSKSSASSNIKFSPYPNYIQPVTEGPSYRREVNRILSHDTGSSPYSHRNRKISTDMNRYESSSSKSSNSESDDETAPRAVAIPKSKNPRVPNAVATPDTSDCESKVGVRGKRRGGRKSGMVSRMQPTSTWDDPYITSLPDNYKTPEAFSSLKSPRSNDSDSNMRHNSQIHNDRNISTTIEPSREIRGAKNSSKEIPDSAEYRGRYRRGNRLNINKAGAERNVEGLGSSLSPSRNADVSLSTPDLARVDRQTSGSNEISANSVYRKPSESGESENYDIASPNSQSNDVVLGNSTIEKVDYEVIQQQPKIRARKVGQHFWPRDEDTERLLTHTKATSNRSQSPEATTVGSHSAASYAMQETIEQLQSFVNETDRHRPLASDRSKSLETVSGSVSPSYAGLRRGSNKFSGVHGQQSSKTSSPHMSSTETLKEAGSSGEYQDKHSRSPSFDSTISNPEFPNGINSRITQRIGKEKSKSSGRLQSKSVSADDLSQPRRDGTTTLKKLHDLTEAMKNIKMPQPSTPTDSISTVSSQNSVSNSQTKLETLNEYPEPHSPAIHKRTGSKKRKAVVRQEFQSGNSLEIDEGVVTDEVHPEDVPFQYLGKPLNRNTHHIQSIDQNDINEPRSRSDPSAERKRVPSSHKNLNHSILGSLRNPRDYGSSGQSIGGSSQNSEQQSSFSDTLNIDELIREEQEDELKKLQSKERMKKKSKSDPNPEGLISLDTETVDKDNGYQYNTSLGPASSEPNGLEQTDILGPLNRFQQHPTGSDALRVKLAPSVGRSNKTLSLSKEGMTPTSRQSLSSSQDSESSSPVQKQEEEITGMFQKSAEEFDIVFENMKNDDKQNVKETVAHTRSSSLPVDNVDYTQHPRYAQRSPYGGSTFNLPKPNARRNTDEQGFVKENFAPVSLAPVFLKLKCISIALRFTRYITVDITYLWFFPSLSAFFYMRLSYHSKFK